MIDHASVNVRDIEGAKSFYSKALEPLGISMAMEMDDFAGFASEKGFHFGVFKREPVGGAHVASTRRRWLPEGRTTARQGCGRTTTRTTTGRGFTTRTATTSRPSARNRSRTP